jgi:adenylate cyclase
LVVLWLVFLAARRFLSPIFTFTQAVAAVGRGILTVSLPDRFDGEIGQLNRAFNEMVQGIREGRVLKRFVSEAAQEAAKHDGREQAGTAGERLEMAVVFVQLAGLKQRLEREPPEAIMTDLNRFLEAMSAIIRQNGGQIDKFIGDKVLAVFTPARFGTVGPAARAACQATLSMQQWAREISNESGRKTTLSAGIVTGPVLWGILGSAETQREYTVIGDTVNLAARLCEVGTHLANGAIVLDRGTRDLLAEHSPSHERPSWKAEPLSIDRIKGKHRSVDVFTLVES